MEDTVLYEKYVRDRITELRVKREISEHIRFVPLNCGCLQHFVQNWLLE